MDFIREYAKAIAGAITSIIVFVVGLVGLELPEEIVAALLLLVTGGVVLAIPNKPKVEVVPAPAPGQNLPHAPVGGPYQLAFAPLFLAGVGEGEALFWIGVLVVVGCLVAAAVAAFRYREYIGAAVLVVIAIIAAVLLL
jgi:hypothetical protein